MTMTNPETVRCLAMLTIDVLDRLQTFLDPTAATVEGPADWVATARRNMQLVLGESLEAEKVAKRQALRRMCHPDE